MASTNLSTDPMNAKFVVVATPISQSPVEKIFYVVNPNTGQQSVKPIVWFGLAVFAVVGVVVALVLVLIPDRCDTVELGTEIRNGGDHVGLIFSACPSERAYEAFLNAAAFWSGVVNGSEFVSILVNFEFDTTTAFCGNFESVVFEAGTVFDHLVIIAETTAIDGPQNILAGAGPCNLFIPDVKQIPLLGVMIFDTADLGELEDNGTFEKVILHEMAHVLGLGTLWQLIKEGGEESSLKLEELLQDPIFDDNGLTFSSNHPKFIGSQAIAEFSVLKGENRTFVPVEDGVNEFGVNFFEPFFGEGEGSIDGHWKKTTFDDELMTFQIDPNDIRHPISRVTLAAIEDAGYNVDYSFAQDYELPVPSAARNGPSSLRGKSTKVFDLTGDARLFKGANDDALKQSIFIRKP